MPEMSRKDKIRHIVLNVPNMSKFTFKMYFGNPFKEDEEVPSFKTPDEYLEFLKQHAKRYLETDLTDLDILYDDIEGNDELTIPLPT